MLRLFLLIWNWILYLLLWPSVFLMSACSSKNDEAVGRLETQRRLRKDSFSSEELLPEWDGEALSFFLKYPANVDFSVIRHWVFSKSRCLSCHSSRGTTRNDKAIFFGANLSSYGDLSYLNGIVKGRLWDSEEGPGSRIFQVVQQSVHPSVSGYLQPAKDQVELLKLWILNCAIETRETSEDGSVFEGGVDDESQTNLPCPI